MQAFSFNRTLYSPEQKGSKISGLSAQRNQDYKQSKLENDDDLPAAERFGVAYNLVALGIKLFFIVIFHVVVQFSPMLYIMVAILTPD